MTQYIDTYKISDDFFIFHAGMLSNMLIYQLTKTHPNNTFLDEGSVFDVYLGQGKKQHTEKVALEDSKNVRPW